MTDGWPSASRPSARSRSASSRPRPTTAPSRCATFVAILVAHHERTGRGGAVQAGPATTYGEVCLAAVRRSAAMLAAVANQADDVGAVSAVQRQQADLGRQEGSRLGPARHLDRPVHAVAESDLEERPHPRKLMWVNLRDRRDHELLAR